MKLLCIVCLATGLLAGTSAPVRADFSVTYRAVSSELVLFGQKQESPFGRLRFAMRVRGPQVRTEMTDHFGHERWFIADRARGKAIGIDPEAHTWWNDPATWSCDDIPGQVARSAAELFVTGGVEELTVGLPESARLADRDVRRVEAHFKGRVLGAPEPAQAVLVLYFPADAAATFGAESLGETFCGAPPAPDAWQKAFTRYLKLPDDRARALAGVVSLPLQIELSADLGLGQASVTLTAGNINHDTLADGTFGVPDGYAERK